MSTRHRPLGEYLRAARKLAETKPQFLYYAYDSDGVERTELTRYEKAAIARVAKFPPLEKRTNENYATIAAHYAKFSPSIAKYKRRKKFNNGEKSYLSKVERVLRYADHLVPIPPRNRKKAIKEQWELYGQESGLKIYAQQLRGTGPDATIIKLDKNMTVTSNGRTWLYWRIDNVKPAGMRKAGKQAFNEFNSTFDIERLAELAKRAFTTRKPVAVELWAESGRVGEPFKTLDEFMQWIYEDYSHYKNVERWVKGIAILIHGTIKDEMREYKQRKAEQRQEKRRYAQLRRQRGG